MAHKRSLVELRLLHRLLGSVALRSETAVPLFGSVTVAAAGMVADIAKPGAGWGCTQREEARRSALSTVGSQSSTGGSSYLSR